MKLACHQLREGDGPPFALLHGFLGRSADWEPLLPHLPGPAVGIDLPGHGDSPLPGDDATWAEVVAAVTSALPENPVLVGYSLGGRVALAVALEVPLRALVLIGTHAGLHEAEERELRRDWDERVAARLEFEPLADFLHEWYRMDLFASLAAQPQLRARLIVERAEQDGRGPAAAMRVLGTGSMPSLWADLPALPVAQAVDVPDAGHTVQLEQPAACGQHLRAFLRQHRII